MMINMNDTTPGQITVLEKYNKTLIMIFKIRFTVLTFVSIRSLILKYSGFLLNLSILIVIYSYQHS